MIAAESVDGVRLIRTILRNDLSGDMRFYAGQGRASLPAVARNLLVHEGGPVLLVMDSDTLHHQLKQELESLAMVAMSGVGSPGLFHVFSFVPEIEAVFFEAPGALTRTLGHEILPQVIEEGQLAPRKTLARILKNARIPGLGALIRKLDEPAIEALAQGTQANAMKEKVRTICHTAAVPSK